MDKLKRLWTFICWHVLIGPSHYADEIKRKKAMALTEKSAISAQELQEVVEKLTQLFTEYFEIRRTDKEKALLLLEEAERITASLKKKLEPTAHI